eukprot:11265946-Ditylum_brightwellii.AAC.1
MISWGVVQKVVFGPSHISYQSYNGLQKVVPGQFQDTKLVRPFPSGQNLHPHDILCLGAQNSNSSPFLNVVQRLSLDVQSLHFAL